MSTTEDNGLIHLASRHSVEETVSRLEPVLAQKGVSIFASIDHSGEAARVGLEMRPTKLLIFGSPKAGTPLMRAAPTIAIDLPLKALIWEDAEKEGSGLLITIRSICSGGITCLRNCCRTSRA